MLGLLGTKLSDFWQNSDSEKSNVLHFQLQYCACTWGLGRDDCNINRFLGYCRYCEFVHAALIGICRHCYFDAGF